MRCPDATVSEAGAPAAPIGAAAVLTCRLRAFTCTIDVATAGPPAVPFGQLGEWLAGLERRFSRFRRDSELSRLNAHAGTWMDISPAMAGMLAHALSVAVDSRGLVNAGVLPRLVAAGYAGSWPQPLEAPVSVRSPLAGPVPPLTQVLEVQPGRARLQPGTALDLGGLAKGMWADELASMLGGNAACSIGGDVACRGPGPGGDGWPVRMPGGAVVAIRDAGVATSGTRRRRWGLDAHHIIDPRTGCPARSGVAEVTVIARTATVAEWAATAIVVGGTAESERLLGRADVLHCFVSADGAAR